MTPALTDGSDNEDESDSKSEDTPPVTNAEIADILPSKTVPKTSIKNRSQTRKKDQGAHIESAPKHSPKVTVKDVNDDNGSFMNHTAEAAAKGSTTPSKPKQGKHSAVYLFFEEVMMDANGERVPGAEYFKCYHGNCCTFKITKPMKNNTNGLTGHLKAHFPLMYWLYEALRDREGPPTPDERNLACGNMTPDSAAAAAVMSGHKTSTEGIQMAFMRQAEV
ncbi:hypothetical protein BDN71DRAFT_1526055 [Pleurotus eryngii]|uniref:Uncharacterized protein n=1 Tax=Pleurotus eryngii TaxID=5323 RepID=A0A9P5ZLY9_PLEER|nr:hypothetical protein BDN71DRAFT_1526055 [Pleurotus eryngii]